MEATKKEQPDKMCLKGRVLLLERELFGLSQAELAARMRKLGVVNARQQKISEWENEIEFSVDEYTFNVMIAAFGQGE